MQPSNVDLFYCLKSGFTFSVLFVFLFSFYCYILVVPSPENITITGLPALVKDGTTEVLTCEVTGINPEAVAIYWIFNERRYNGTQGNTINNDGTFTQETFLEFR